MNILLGIDQVIQKRFYCGNNKLKLRLGNRKTARGLKSKIQGGSFEKNATTGVGGPCTYFFHEGGWNCTKDV